MSKFTITLVFSQGSREISKESYRVHEKCTSSRIHGKIFTKRQGYSSIETHATAVFVNKCVMPYVVHTSRYLNQENIQVPITILFAHSYKSTITPLRFNLYLMLYLRMSHHKLSRSTCFVIRHMWEGFGARFISLDVSKFLCHWVISNNRIAVQKQCDDYPPCFVA